MKKSLGQHWLKDATALNEIATPVSKRDTVLEIGPGLGSLTRVLCQRAERVVAVEADAELVRRLKNEFVHSNVEVVHQDILKFNLQQLPKNYKVVANIPYYITSSLLRMLLESPNTPTQMSLLVQKEVGERITATPGQMSILAFSVQYYATAKMGGLVSKEKFQPPPKVDSVIIQIDRRPKTYFKADTKKLFRLVKAGFGERRKQLKNSLAGGLHKSPGEVSKLLKNSGVKPEARAQELSLDDWKQLYISANDHDLI